MNGLPGGLPDLGQPRMLTLREQRIIGLAQVEVIEGGLTDAECVGHLRVVDLVNAVAYYVPLNPTQLHELGRGAFALEAEYKSNDRSEGSKDDGHAE